MGNCKNCGENIKDGKDFCNVICSIGHRVVDDINYPKRDKSGDFSW